MKFFVWYISCLSFSLSMIISWWFQNASLIDAFSSCDAWMRLQPATINCRCSCEGGCGGATVKAVVPQIWPCYSSAWSPSGHLASEFHRRNQWISQAGTVLSFCQSAGTMLKVVMWCDHNWRIQIDVVSTWCSALGDSACCGDLFFSRFDVVCNRIIVFKPNVAVWCPKQKAMQW